MPDNLLEKASFLSAFQTATVHSVEIEGAGTVFLRSLTMAERQRVFELAIAKSPRQRALMICLAVCDAAGARLFSDADAAEIEQLTSPWVERVFFEALRVNLMDEDGVAALRGKNSPPSTS